MDLLLDDKLEVYALKCSTDGKKRRLPLSGYWKHESFLGATLGYWIPGTRNWVSPKKYKWLSPDQQRCYVECHKHIIPCNAPDTYMEAQDNRFIIRMVKLSYGDEPRLLSSRMALLVEEISSHRPGIFPYNPQLAATHIRGISNSLRESTRHLIKTYFKPLSYEIGILFTDREIGLAAYKEWKQRALNPKQPGSVISGTVYLTGLSARKEGDVTVKVYDHGARHNGNPGLYKIEVTYRSKAFKQYGVSIEDFSTQENCMARFKEDFLKRLCKLSAGPVTHKIAQEAPDLRPLAALVRSATEVKCA